MQNAGVFSYTETHHACTIADPEGFLDAFTVATPFIYPQLLFRPVHAVLLLLLRSCMLLLNFVVSRVPAVEPRWYGIIFNFNGEFRV